MSGNNNNSKPTSLQSLPSHVIYDISNKYLSQQNSDNFSRTAKGYLNTIKSGRTKKTYTINATYKEVYNNLILYLFNYVKLVIDTLPNKNVLTIIIDKIGTFKIDYSKVYLNNVFLCTINKITDENNKYYNKHKDLYEYFDKIIQINNNAFNDIIDYKKVKTIIKSEEKEIIKQASHRASISTILNDLNNFILTYISLKTATQLPEYKKAISSFSLKMPLYEDQVDLLEKWDTKLAFSYEDKYNILKNSLSEIEDKKFAIFKNLKHLIRKKLIDNLLKKEYDNMHILSDIFNPPQANSQIETYSQTIFKYALLSYQYLINMDKSMFDYEKLRTNIYKILNLLYRHYMYNVHLNIQFEGELFKLNKFTLKQLYENVIESVSYEKKRINDHHNNVFIPLYEIICHLYVFDLPISNNMTPDKLETFIQTETENFQDIFNKSFAENVKDINQNKIFTNIIKFYKSSQSSKGGRKLLKQ